MIRSRKQQNQQVTNTIWRHRPTSLDALVETISQAHPTGFSYTLQPGQHDNTTHLIATWKKQFIASIILHNNPKISIPNANSRIKNISIYHINEKPEPFGLSQLSMFRRMQRELELLLINARKEKMVFEKNSDLKLLARSICWLTRCYNYVCANQKSTPFCRLQL